MQELLAISIDKPEKHDTYHKETNEIAWRNGLDLLRWVQELSPYLLHGLYPVKKKENKGVIKQTPKE